MKKTSLICMLLICSTIVSYAGEAFTVGERLFRSNKPTEAIPYLVQAMTESPIEPAVFNYLGLSYYQIGQLQNSLDAFIQGTTVSGTNKKLLYYNAGNTAFAMGLFDKSIEMYSMALTADPSYASAMLNRANSKLKQDNLAAAVSDYTQYLGLAPDSSQRAQIEALIAMLQVEQENREVEEVRRAEEEQRIAVEEKRIAEEQQRIAEQKAAEEAVAAQLAEQERIEQERLAAQVAAEVAAKEAARKAAEAERRRLLLEEVASSLQDASSTNMTAGSEGVMEYEQESELD